MARTILTPLQRRCLDWVAQQPPLTKRFYLSGGTALAEFSLHHRYSEDLDFFTEEEFDVTELQPSLLGLKTALKARAIRVENRLNRHLAFFETPKETLKTEFSWFVGTPIEKGIRYGGLRVDGALDIAVNKVFTVYQRPRARDYVDLYFLIPMFPLLKLLDLARAKFDWHIDVLQLGTRFNDPDLSDYPRMLKKLAPQTVRKYFRTLALQLEKDILA